MAHEGIDLVVAHGLLDDLRTLQIVAPLNVLRFGQRAEGDLVGLDPQTVAGYAVPVLIILYRLEKAVMDTVNSGIMTQDLALLYEGEAQTVTSRMFLYAVASKLPAAE